MAYLPLPKLTGRVFGAALFISLIACSVSKGGLGSGVEDQGGDGSNDGGPRGKKMMGAACAAGMECGTGFCEQGVCCDIACAAGCVSCALEGKLGQCTPLPPKSQPRFANACPKELPVTCGFDGSCDGSGGCRQHEEGTVCGLSTCTAEQETAITCNGKGTCNTRTQKACTPFICGDRACATECRSDAECRGGTICLARKCQVADAPLVKFTVALPTIDGFIDDEAWKSQEWLPVSQLLQGVVPAAADLTPRFKLLWTKTDLFILVDIADNDLINRSPGFANDDAVMLCLDPNNSGGESPDGVDDLSYVFSWGESTAFEELNLGRKQGVKYALQYTPSGYALEARLPWQTLTPTPPVEGLRIGLQVAIFDGDNEGNETVLAWTGANLMATTVPRLFGKVILGRN